MNALDGQRNGVANRGFFAGEPDERFQQQDSYRFTIECQRYLQVCPLAEKNQANAIAFAAADEITCHRLRRCQPVDATIAEFEILLIHTAGQVDSEHQVAPRYRDVEFITNTFRPCRGNDQQNPRHSGEPESPIQELLGIRPLHQRRESRQRRHLQAGILQASATRT